MTGSGYRVDTAGLREAAGKFAAVRDQVETTATALGSTKVPDGAFGDHGPGPQLAADLDKIVGLWQQHLTGRHQAVGRFADNVTAAADSYDRTDSDGAHGITDAGRGA